MGHNETPALEAMNINGKFRTATGNWGMVALGILSISGFAGCLPGSSVTPPSITADGFHASLPAPRAKVIIWGVNPGAVSAAMTWGQQKGLVIVERARLDQILQEQAIRLTHTSDDEAQLLRVGHIAGADLLMFVEVSGSSGQQGSFVGVTAGLSSVRMLHQVRVSVRAVNLETAEVVLAGTATHADAISSPEEAITTLTARALERAWCDKDRWTDGSCRER